MTYPIARDIYTDERYGVGVGDATLPVAFSLGLLGVFIGHQLTRSVNRAGDAIEAAPCNGVRRTAALCLACLVPGAVALAWLATMLVVLVVWPVPDSPAVSSADRAAMLSAAVPYAVGGPLVGVLVARWTSFPGSGLLSVLALVVWALLGTIGLALPASRPGTLLRLSAPYASWVSSDGQSEPSWVAGGSPQWYLVYVCLLCGLAVTAALYRAATQEQRPPLRRVGVLFLAVALTSLGLAAAADPARVLL
jgi:hypothetical protein